MSKQAIAMEKMYQTGQGIEVNPDNKYTQRRRKKYMELTNENSGDLYEGLNFALQEVENNRGDIEKYVIARGEVPNKDSEGLALQAYQLRSDEIDAIAATMNLPDADAQIFLEDSEAEEANAMGDDYGSHIGEHAATVGYVAQCLNDKVNNFVDPNLVAGVINTAGAKISSAALVRAAQGKPAGVLGFLNSGGTKTYNALREYFAKNPEIKKKVLSGQITDISQTGFTGDGSVLYHEPTGGLNLSAQDIIDEVRKAETKKAIKKALPFIIIGVIVIILVSVYIARRKK